ncbi:flagellar hook-length control protein FliK [Clostridium botulinum]|uniref:flagellar hook-length control protein FliK n=1 Tax=Clostridium botulinum TaxID=1491 RepID=UPI00035F8D7A|nr:flagellar hook-length control protein FliK [Clostridium botulinum]MBN1034654.1 flagellar hook-length control protein FliK [Clostridium botulinum]MBN1073469.1 flagellar hook-length control protein FliK [Clostridium botulinum]NFE73483.1 flagellar hook-length control protein FliK [Clostridium botulinum]NFE95075.1 flagellar hook-length control protein FliK [Clostridium botulinum]NFL37149.1 flagellar hook-length control protein FliK [Clostridium botulinum]
MKMNISSNLKLTSLNAEPKKTSSKVNNVSSSNDKNNTTKSKDDTSFKDVLNEKSSTKVETKKDDSKNIKDKVEVTDENVNDKDVSVEDKINEIEEKIDNASKDEIIEMLNSIFNMLSSVKNENIEIKDLNTDILNSIINNSGKENSNLSKLLENLLTASESPLTNLLNSDNKDLLNKLLSKLGNKLDEDTDVSNKVKDLMSQISSSLENKENKTYNFNTAFKNFEQNANPQMNNQNIEEEKVPTSTSDEDDFLNKLLNNNKDDSVLNKINLLSSRNEINSNNVAASTESVTINKATMGDDLIKNVKLMITNSMKELTVKINPKDLGQVTISLIQENGIMKANIKANSKETFELLSQNLVEMKKAIGEQNIKVADVNVELYQEDTTFFKDEGFGRGLAKENQKQNSNNGETSEIDSIELEDDVTEDLNSNLDFFA